MEEIHRRHQGEYNGASTTTPQYVNQDLPVGIDPARVGSITHKREVSFWEYMTSAEFYPNNALIGGVGVLVALFYFVGCLIIYFLMSRLGVWELAEVQNMGLYYIFIGLMFVGFIIIASVLYALAYFLTADYRYKIVNY